MALQTSGQISLLDVRTELKKDGKISLDDSDVRKLAEKESGEIKLSDFYGKSHSIGDIYMKDVYFEDGRWIDPHPDTNVINLKSIRFEFNYVSVMSVIILKVETKSPSVTLSENITLYFENDLIGVQKIDFKKQNGVYIKLFPTSKDNIYFHQFKLYYDKKYYNGESSIRFHLAKTGVDIGIEDKLGEILRFASMVKDDGYYFVTNNNYFEPKIKIGKGYSYILPHYNSCSLFIMADRPDFPKTLYVVLHNKKDKTTMYSAKFYLASEIEMDKPIEYFYDEERIDQIPMLTELKRSHNEYYISILQTLDYEKY